MSKLYYVKKYSVCTTQPNALNGYKAYNVHVGAFVRGAQHVQDMFFHATETIHWHT